MFRDVSLEASAELFDVFHRQGQSGSVSMSAKVFEQVGTALHRLIHIEARHRTRRPCGHAFGTCQHHRRTIVLFGQARSHDADNALVPVLAVNHDASAFIKSGQILYAVNSLFGHLLVEVLSRLIVKVDASCLFECHRKILFHQQVHSFLTVLHTSRRIDARSDFKDDVVHRQFAVRKSAHFDDSLQSDTRIRVQAAQSVVSQDAVFAHNRHNVRSNAHGTEVEQRSQFVKLNAIALRKSLHKLKSDATARKVGVRVMIVASFRVQNCHGAGQRFVGHMVVADDEVDAQ